MTSTPILASTGSYTKGGWNRNIYPASKYPTIFAGRNTHVARIIPEHLPESEVEANCNLIAAAPALYEALAALLEVTQAGPATASAEKALRLANGIYE